MAKKDWYKILNIPPQAELKAIKSAYRMLALKYHPDHNPGDSQAAELFAEIKQAYEILSTPNERKQYDSQYKPSPQTPHVEVDPVKDFKNTKVKNLRYNLFITLEDIVKGAERSIRYIRKNNNEPETIQLKVKVPQGAYHHQRLKVSGYGDIGPTGSGHLFVIIHIQNHPIFHRQENQLRINVPVSYLEILLGSDVDVLTLYGLQKVSLKAGEFEKLDHTIKGFGLPSIREERKGDLKIHFFMEHPSDFTAAEKKALLKQLSDWPKGELQKQYQSYLKEKKVKK